jgi:hypothetical protein
MSMEDGAPPRDILRRRVRVGEYYRIPWSEGCANNSYSFYDESKDSWQNFTYKQLLKMAHIDSDPAEDQPETKWELVVARPFIEHNMLGVILGRGGLEDLGATLWGQTELSVYDDSMHGIWGMSYKYNERAIVYNEKNLVRLWDVAYDGYNGGKDCTHLDWRNPVEISKVTRHIHDLNRPYEGVSMMVMRFQVTDAPDNQPPPVWSSPIYMSDDQHRTSTMINADDNTFVNTETMCPMNSPFYADRMARYNEVWSRITQQTPRTSGTSAQENETMSNSGFLFQGSYKIIANGTVQCEITGSGHHGADYVGAASVRNGKGFNPSMHNTSAKVC